MAVDAPNPNLTTTTHGEERTTAPEDTEAGELRRGEVVDRYLVINALGSGGGGTVYKAHDTDLDRNVAIKVVRRRSDANGDALQTAQALREGKAMAKLAHPNVVAVHDVGPCRAGIFIAMELVDGVDLAQWLADAPRSEAAILRAFVQAAKGLAAAHDAGIVHGDFKPANVFVDRTGRVRVGDFGLARAASDVGVARSGTPMYMAPEIHDGATAGQPADQFSFCLALLEALLGKHPLEGMSRPAIADAVRELPAAPGPRWLRAAVARGLRVEPSERFESMTALVDLLEREPARFRRRKLVMASGVFAIAALGLVWVTAGETTCDPATRTSAMWSTDRRASVRAALGDADAVLGDDTAGRVAAAVDSWVESWASAYAEICAATLIDAVQSRALLDARMSCLEERRLDLDAQLRVFESADADVVRRAVHAVSRLPGADACRTVTDGDAPPPELAKAVENAVLQLAEARALERAGRFSAAIDAAAPARDVDHPRTQAAAALALGKAHAGSGAYADAEAQLTHAHFHAEAHHHDAIAAEAATELVYVLGERSKRVAEALAWEPHARSAVARSGDAGRLQASLLSALGSVKTTQQAFPEALALFEEALEVQRGVTGANHVDTISIRGNVANILDYLGRSDEAAQMLREVAEASEAQLGPNHPAVARVLGNLAGVEVHREDFARARELFEDAVAIKRRALGNDNPSLVPSLDGLAIACKNGGDIEAAVKYREEALRIAELKLGDAHPNLAAVLINHGNLLLSTDDPEGAAAALTRALEVIARAHGPEHPLRGTTLTSLGSAELNRGNTAAAIKHQSEAQQIFAKSPGEASVQYALATSNLARAHHKAGHLEKAEALYRAAKPALIESSDSRRKDFERRVAELRADLDAR